MTRSTDENTVEIVSSVLAEHPVAVGYLFGSQARDEADENSDIDIAVVFEGCEPGDQGHADARFGLGADLAVALGTDDIDVIDLQSAPPTLVRTVFNEGERLVGSEREARRLRDRLLTNASEDERSATERFDEILAAIDEHLA